MPDIRPLLTRAEAAEFLTERGLRIGKGTLQKFACVGGGPEYQIFGNRALYRPDALLSWAESRLSDPQASTSKRRA